MNPPLRSRKRRSREPLVLPLRASTFRYPGGPLVGERGVVMAFAVGIEGRWVLLDTGIGLGNAELESVYQPTTWDPIATLERNGVAPAKIEAVVNSHLHFDHAGFNRLFPGIPLWIQQTEWDVFRTPDYTVVEWVDFDSARYERIVGDKADLLPGVSILSTPGHTPGHQSLLIEGHSRSTVLAGQACYGPTEWSAQQPAIDGSVSAWSRDMYNRSLARLRSLKPHIVWFSHDEQPWRLNSQPENPVATRSGFVL